MCSCVIEFNLAEHGDDADGVLADAARTWPESRESPLGVLAAFRRACVGRRVRIPVAVDIDSFATLARVDDTMKADRRWRKARADWLQHRTVARAYVTKCLGENEAYSGEFSAEKGGAIHFVYQSAPRESGSADRLERLRSISGVMSVQSLGSLAGGAAQEQAGLRLESIESLDAVTEADLEAASGACAPNFVRCRIVSFDSGRTLVHGAGNVHRAKTLYAPLCARLSLGSCT